MKPNSSAMSGALPTMASNVGGAAKGGATRDGPGRGVMRGTSWSAKTRPPCERAGPAEFAVGASYASIVVVAPSIHRGRPGWVPPFPRCAIPDASPVPDDTRGARCAHAAQIKDLSACRRLATRRWSVEKLTKRHRGDGQRSEEHTSEL